MNTPEQEKECHCGDNQFDKVGKCIACKIMQDCKICQTDEAFQRGYELGSKINIPTKNRLDFAFKAGEQSMITKIQNKIGYLRQWLNEDRITDKKMVTNEEIEKMLFLFIDEQ